MLCNGPEPENCCNYYMGHTCVDHCPSPYVPDADHNCVCPPESADEGIDGISTPMIMCHVFNLRV